MLLLRQAACSRASTPPLRRVENHFPPLQYYLSEFHLLCKRRWTESGFFLQRPGSISEVSSGRFRGPQAAREWSLLSLARSTYWKPPRESHGSSVRLTKMMITEIELTSVYRRAGPKAFEVD